jgi:gliding motility-associated-like protein
MPSRLLLAILFVCLAFSYSASAQDFSNKGKDFWIGYGNHVRMFNGNPAERMQLYITSDVATSGQVTISSVGFSQSFTVTPNQITTIDIPRSAALMDDGLYNHGIHVTADKPVVVYSFIYVNAISGATVCLPTATLGRDYFSVNYRQISNDPGSHSYFFVIAADTGTTTVEITPSETTKGGKSANVPFLVTLQQGQVYQVLGTISGTVGVDLTGSRIRSINTGTGCKRIAVFSGSGKVSIGCGGAGTSDNLYQQMYPTATWGKKYITVPSAVNSNNYFRIVKSDGTANVTLNGAPIASASFVNNFYYEFSGSTTNVIESDKPILVAQYFTTQKCSGNGIGDPEMIYLNPVEQTISSVTLNSMQPSGINVNTHYLNVVVKNDPAAINSFSIDGVPRTNFTPVPGDNAYAYAQISTTAGTHNIKCDTGFNIIAYGFGDIESYGFSGGTNLKDLYQFVSIKNKYSVVDYPATCTDAPFNFSMTFPYMPTKVQWKFSGLYPDEVINSPVPDSTWIKNGKQLYLYKLSKIYKGPQPGTYSIKIIATNPTVDGCTGEQEIDFDLQVYQKPIADFTITTGGCLGDSTYFTDQSVTGSNLPIKWSWDFGNGDVASTKNAAYLYKSTGSYTASFSVITQVGCITDTAKKPLVISPVPVASFTATGPYCAGRDIEIKDASSIASGGTIAKWMWDMGDGQTMTKTSSAPFSYVYTKTGQYTISLITESGKGCRSKAFTQQIEVGAIPKVGFKLPENCLSDPFSQFTDTSSIADGTPFTYLWNFGDSRSTPANNIATIKNPKHKYTATGDYTVSLLVTSNKGCADSSKQMFTINGAVPQSLFTIDNGTEECSNKTVTVTNNSIVDVGKIVRLEIYWDYTNDPTNKLLDEEPQAGKKYSFQYPSFFTPTNKTYTIQVVAYSGDNCLSSLSKTITVKAIPQLQFTSINPVCADVAPFQITQASVINGMTGTGVFSGKGISNSGMFNPAAATIGIDSIQYRFTAINGCINAIKQAVEVYALPKVNAGVDQYLLEGGSLTIPATASGINVRYLWSPATALSSTTVLQPQASPTDDITYKLTVTSSQGCKASDATNVTVLKTPGVPNTFSPNGDGIHDRWEIKYLDTYPGATVEIFNRYGQLVFRSTGYAKSWDGTYNGQPLPVGTYYYIINPKNGRKQMSGYIDIIR